MKRTLALMAVAASGLCSSAVAEDYHVDITASVGPICVLPTPTSSDSALDILETTSSFTTVVGADGKVQSTSGTLTFTGAYCNGASTLTLKSSNDGGGLKPQTAVATGFAPSIDYTAEASWAGEGTIRLTPADDEVSAALAAASGDLTLRINVDQTELPLSGEEYRDMVTMTVAVGS